MSRTWLPDLDGILGIDPGLSGGLAFISLDDSYIKVSPMPVLKGDGKGSKSDIYIKGLLDFIAEIEINGGKIITSVIEVVHSMPKQGVSSVFTFGKGYGMVIGALQATNVPIIYAQPTAWKRDVLVGTLRDKAAAIQYCVSRYPKVNLLATPRSKVLHDGMADALCLAVHGRRLEGLDNGKVQGFSTRRTTVI